MKKTKKPRGVDSKKNHDSVNSSKKQKTKRTNLLDSKKDDGFDLVNSPVAFIRNLDMNTTEKDLLADLKKKYKVKKVKMLRNEKLKVKTGSAFVEFANSQELNRLLETEKYYNSKMSDIAGKKKKDSITLGSNVIAGGGLTIDGKKVWVTRATEKGELLDIIQSRSKKSDTRHAHLLNYPDIDIETEAFRSLPKDVQTKWLQTKQNAKLKFSNTNFHVNPKRVTLSNIPAGIQKKHVSEAVPRAILAHPDSASVLNNNIATIMTKGKMQDVSNYKAKRKVGEKLLAIKSIKQILVLHETIKQSNTNGKTNYKKGSERNVCFVEFYSHDIAKLFVEIANLSSDLWGDNFPERHVFAEFTLEHSQKQRTHEIRKNQRLHKGKGK